MPTVYADPATSAALNAMGAGGAPTADNPLGDLFPGLDSNKQGADYLKQFPPELQQGALDYLAGRRMPTGNPRRQDVTRTIAAKYGGDIGVPADDTAFAARKTFRNGLEQRTPTSAGGQLQNGTTAMEHLSRVAEAAHALGNYDVLGIAPLGHAVNALRGYGTEQAAKMKYLQAEALKYGQEITKFYAGSGGGVEERRHFLEALSAASTPQELAAVIQAERELIPAKMDQIRNDIDYHFGPEGRKEFAHKFADQEKHQARTQEFIDKMLGRPPAGASVAAPAAAPAAAPDAGGEGTIAVNKQTGQRLRLQGDRWVPANVVQQ